MQRVEFFLRQIWYNGFNKEEFLMNKNLIGWGWPRPVKFSIWLFRRFCGCHAGIWWGKKVSTKLRVASMIWFCSIWCYLKKNGFQVLKELREKGITTPVLIMTAKESLDDKGHGFELGADDYLTKPFYLEELKMRIQALLKRSGKFNEKHLDLWKYCG